MACKIGEGKVLNLKLCESLLFSNFFHRFIFVLLEDKQKGKYGGLDIPSILPHLYHSICPLFSLVYGFRVCFTVFSGLGTF